METFGWPRNYVARCPVRMFEVAGGGISWLPRGTAGEFHMRALDNTVLFFQLRDVPNNQILFEHTMRKPDAFLVLSQRFFVIRLENGSFRGFAFDDLTAARELKEQVQKAIKPHSLQEYDGGNITSAFPVNGIDTSFSRNRISAVCASKPGESSVPKHSAIPAQPPKEERVASIPSFELVTFSQTTKSSKWKFSWKRLTSFSYLRNFTEAFGWQEHEMEIGHPTDVKHVGHIGWDGPSVCGPSWIDELKPSSDFATGPLKEFGQPMGSDWIHDALSAAKWTAPGLRDQSGPPPAPPAEFLDSGMPHSQKESSRWNLIWLRRKSRNSSAEKPRAGQM